MRIRSTRTTRIARRPFNGQSRTKTAASTAPLPASAFRLERYKTSRFWGVYDEASKLVCVCVDKKGAAELVHRLSASAATKRGGKRCQAR